MKKRKIDFRRALLSGILALLLINPGLNTPRPAYAQDLVEYALLAAILALSPVLAIQEIANEPAKWIKQSSRLVVLKMMNDTHGRLTAMIDALTSGSPPTNSMRADWEVIAAHLSVVRNKGPDGTFNLEDLLVEVDIIETLSQIAEQVYEDLAGGGDRLERAGVIETPLLGSKVSGNNVRISGTFGVTGEDAQIYVDGKPVGDPIPVVNFGEVYETGWDTTTVPDGQHLISIGVVTTNERQRVFSAILVTVSNAPPRACGDGICDRLAGENCQTCALDCGPC